MLQKITYLVGCLGIQAYYKGDDSVAAAEAACDLRRMQEAAYVVVRCGDIRVNAVLPQNKTAPVSYHHSSIAEATMQCTSTTVSHWVEWIVVAEGRVAGLYHTRPKAEQRAGYDGLVAAPPSRKLPELALSIGQRCRVDKGEVLPV